MPMPRHLFLVGIILASASSYRMVSAQEAAVPAIAVVNLTEVFAAHPKTAAATKQLTDDREASRKDFKEKSNTLKQILQKHQELIRAGKKDAAAEELKKANEAEKAIATLRTTGLRDLEEKFRIAKKEILTDVQAAVAEWNESGKYAVILDSSSSSSTGLPQVVHAPGAEDVTEAVIAFLKKRESEKKP
jgi:Skp family chaperone for outer membrane proteins